MSNARGNVNKSGPPKYQNKSAFRNNLHDNSQRTKKLNAMEIAGTCARCTDLIAWKIKYKKYKPLTVPSKCTICFQKCVKRAYYVICNECHEKTGKCAKCGKIGDVVAKPGPSAAEESRLQSAYDMEIRLLSERQRRSYFRLQAAGKLSEECSRSPSLFATTNNVDGDGESENDSETDESENEASKSEDGAGNTKIANEGT